MASDEQSAATLAAFTERDLIGRIRARLSSPADWLLVGIGDDAAVVEPAKNRVEVLTVDAVVEGVHFDRAFVPADAIGHRALAVNLSDLAAMGAAPRLALLSLVLPPTLLLSEFDGIIQGVATLAARHGMRVVGGNLARSPGPLIVDITAIGTVKRRQALTRGGARPGDELYVSGTIGSAAAGLESLRRQLAGARSSGDDGVPAPNTGDTPLIDAYLRPAPRIRIGTLLSRNRAATACMDLSDGLSDAVYQIAEASGVGAEIDADALPIDPAARAVLRARHDDPIVRAITAGDDYELLAAVRPRMRRRLAAVTRHGDVPLRRIGIVTADRAVVLKRSTAGGVERMPLPRDSYAHFGAVDRETADATSGGASSA
jgi:thiamine-monophosphate kinase